MADLQIPNLNNKSDKFIFKNKLSLRRKSKTKLIKELIYMLFLSLFIIYLNYLIPNKIIIFNNFLNNFNKLIDNILDSVSHVYEIFLVIFMIISTILAFALVFGSISRLLKILKRKTKRVKFYNEIK